MRLRNRTLPPTVSATRILAVTRLREPAPSPDDADRALRLQLAQRTRRGFGMTMAAALYWLAMALVIARAGLAAERLAWFFLLATLVVYPLGWLLTRLGGGDLLARGHPWSGLVTTIAAAPWLAWPLLLTVFLRDPELLAFTLAAILGGHFLPYAWLYRSRAYAALALVTVGLAAVLQWTCPPGSPAVALAMAPCYAIAAAWAWRENRRERRGP